MDSIQPNENDNDYLVPVECNDRPEKYVTLSEISEALGIPLFAVRRAASSGDIPVYKLGNGRLRVRLSEVVQAIEASKKGGANG